MPQPPVCRVPVCPVWDKINNPFCVHLWRARWWLVLFLITKKDAVSNRTVCHFPKELYLNVSLNARFKMSLSFWCKAGPISPEYLSACLHWMKVYGYQGIFLCIGFLGTNCPGDENAIRRTGHGKKARGKRGWQPVRCRPVCFTPSSSSSVSSAWSEVVLRPLSCATHRCHGE